VVELKLDANGNVADAHVAEPGRMSCANAVLQSVCSGIDERTWRGSSRQVKHFVPGAGGFGQREYQKRFDIRTSFKLK